MPDWRRTYWSVWLANLVTSIGMMSFLPFFPSLLEEMGLSDKAEVSAWAGAIFGAAPLSATLMSPIWGALGDRFGRKLMVVRSMIAIAVFVGGMGLARTPLELFLMRIGQGLFSGFIPPSITLVSVGAPADRQGRVASDLTTALALGGMFGPLFGGWLANATGSHKSVFLVVAVLSTVSALLVWFVAVEDAGQRQSPAGGFSAREVLRGTWRDVRDVWRNPRVRGVVLLIFFLQFGLGAINPLMELHVRDLVAGDSYDPRRWAWLARILPGVDAEDPGGVATFATSVVFGGMAICNLMALPLWGRYGDRVGHRQAIVHCAVASALLLFFQAAATIYIVLFASRVLMGAAMAGAPPLAFGMAASEVPMDRRGGAMGVVFSARTLSVAIGGMAGGMLARFVGIRGLMVGSAVVTLLALLALRNGAGDEGAIRDGRQLS